MSEGTFDGAERTVAEVLRARREQIAQRWADQAFFRTVYVSGRDAAVEAARRLTDALADVADGGRGDDPWAAGFEGVRTQLGETIAARTAAGSPLTRMLTDVAELREPVLTAVDEELDGQGERRWAARAAAVELLGTLRLVVMDTAVDKDAAVVARQRQEILEMATPVLKLWDGVLSVPLIGTLDSARSQVVMETLLESIVEHQARVAILDITGVPMVDTVVAQHLMKTALAVRLMGTECVVSGIRPQIAQTIASLGIDLGEIRTRATLADALGYALRRIGAPLPG
ncbi:STAS domain-containing protein [Actinomadura sp. NPDC047616]|uniref:STAS domain-containing protein n=1 Tax=Actinomadura sp. NPDC047616 TaxID=3155914 RepID=UPI0033EB0BA8